MDGLKDRNGLDGFEDRNGLDGLEDRDGLSKTSELLEGPDRMDQDSRVLILPVNGESRKITQILSNETSLKILELLGKKACLQLRLQRS
ncbi:MAG: hypothetical protein NHB15_07730 [Methanosarcina barkeri]|nr:hypothetical protein [Methanosarcina sp. ERenArc_MAG2]